MGFIEAGASDFWVPRGYVHVIANLRGTGGSGGTFGFFDAQQRRDQHDLVEWAAAQPWCDGNVGMIGISYFAMSQLEAAAQRPPHLEAILPVAVTTDLYEAAMHHGLFSSGFVRPWALSAARAFAQKANPGTAREPPASSRSSRSDRDSAAPGRARPTLPLSSSGSASPLEQALDVVGDIQLELQASATAIDTAWIVTLQDVAPDGTVVDAMSVWDAFYQVLRCQGITTIFGNPARTSYRCCATSPTISGTSLPRRRAPRSEWRTATHWPPDVPRWSTRTPRPAPAMPWAT
jgi:predicted acyl esterase